MGLSWNVLVVDDEDDIHNITKLALKRRLWRERPIALTSARSGEEARKILQAPGAPDFHCALVDVVMETDDAGLKLCDFIRSNMSRATRLVLRTGQPGAAPPEKVLNDYDIDYYLAKTEVTPERLFVTLRACFRSSQDISALLAMSAQLRAFTIALQDVSASHEVLAKIMGDSLRFLDAKYGSTSRFVHDKVKSDAPAEVLEAVAMAHKQKLEPVMLHPGETLGLPPRTFVVTMARLEAADRMDRSVGLKVKRWLKNLLEESTEEAAAAIVVTFDHALAPKLMSEFQQDLELFAANWRLAESTLRLQDKLTRERMEMLKQYGTG